MNKPLRLAVLTGFLAILWPISVTASHNRDFFCGQATFRICGLDFIAPPGSAGNLLSFDLPEKYAIRTATVQCVFDSGTGYYKLINEDVASCVLRTCKPGAVTICNTSFDIKTEAHIGTIVKTEIPPSYLIASAAASPPSFSTECRLVKGVEQYEVTDASGVSCNIFPCQPATLNICGSTVTLASPAEMGAVIQAMTNDREPVTVQCLGSGGNRPVYQITDSSAVTCD